MLSTVVLWVPRKYAFCKFAGQSGRMAGGWALQSYLISKPSLSQMIFLIFHHLTMFHHWFDQVFVSSHLALNHSVSDQPLSVAVLMTLGLDLPDLHLPILNSHPPPLPMHVLALVPHVPPSPSSQGPCVCGDKTTSASLRRMVCILMCMDVRWMWMSDNVF